MGNKASLTSALVSHRLNVSSKLVYLKYNTTFVPMLLLLLVHSVDMNREKPGFAKGLSAMWTFLSLMRYNS